MHEPNVSPDIEDGLLSADASESKSGLFVPNEFLGYRILSDEYNWTVCAIRKHGPASKSAGQEYAKPLAYCKTLAFAADWIISRDARMMGEMHDLKTAIQMASDRAMAAIEDLTQRLATDGNGRPLARLI
jgi:hypothetical protein